MWTLTALKQLLFRWSHQFLPYKVVDINGWGHYRTVQDALDAGAKHVLVKAGTYPAFVCSGDNIFIEGESWDAIINGGTTTYGVLISGSRCTLTNLQAKTTPGGGTSYHAVRVTGTFNRIKSVYISGSDNYGIDGAGADTTVEDCLIASTCDNTGLTFEAVRGRAINNVIAAVSGPGIQGDGASTNLQIIGNHVKAVASSIVLNAGDNYSLVVGNICDGTVDNASTGSTVANNLTY